MRQLAFGLILILWGCGPSNTPAGPTADPTVPGRTPLELPIVPDNLRHDTLLVQVTLGLSDSTYLMVASNRDETFEGLRLYRYRLDADSNAAYLAVSSPAYDSWTMLPTCFAIDTARPTEALWVLANFGEKESWGQKVMLLDHAFMDIGFMEVALPERVLEDDTLRLKRRNVAPAMRYSEHGDTAVWLFACDSVFLYDDQEGRSDQVVHASQLRYTYEVTEGLALWVNGRKRLVRKPS
ncbi:MAG: hypothetical protein IPN62_02995 [Flavobacteriales bacterium]|jgi:hypothetical protein|nr:hypothetical protein [Flavobacteriales bacterium]MBP7449746.1 hypothetical protein [Flavobacteriales bacterium]HOZ41492.1 hypothetical protein [Flavobacteriales bacterium]